MKLYMHPASTASRVVMHSIADHNTDVEYCMIDILKGEHHSEAFTKVNPNRLVPVLVDGDFTLTESVAILRYLAAKVDSAAYPKDLRTRARVDEALDWFNVNFYKDWGYGLVYPQLFPHHKRPTEAMQAGTLAWAVDRCRVWLRVLNDHMLAGDHKFLCGDQVTLADYLGIAVLTLGELIHCDLSAYPNITRWVANVKAAPSYAKVYEVFNGFTASTKGGSFVTV